NTLHHARVPIISSHAASGSALSRSLALLAAYAFSGALALVYEIAWTRRLALVFGGAHLAVTTALVAFMSGLAIGAHFSGRRQGGRSPLVRYAWLELAIGAFGIGSTFLIDLVERLYLSTWPAESQDQPGFLAYRFLLMAAV